MVVGAEELVVVLAPKIIMPGILIFVCELLLKLIHDDAFFHFLIVVLIFLK